MKIKVFVKLSVILYIAVQSLCSFAQFPPSSIYTNLLIYRSDAVLDKYNNFVNFTGVDYFYLDLDDDGDLWALYYDFDRGHWVSNGCSLEGSQEDCLKYSTYNPLGEEIIFLIRSDCSDLIAVKENSDLTVCYVIANGATNSSPSYTPGYTPPAYSGEGTLSTGSYGNSSGSSGRTCTSCGGSGKCKTCGGKGYYYHETGYYTGNSHQTRTDCPVCRGTGNCGTCYGRGSIR